MPRRHGKSFHISERFPAWFLAKYPKGQFICASYGMDLTLDFSRKCRDLIREDWIKEIFPKYGLRKDSQSLHKWHTNYGGHYIPGGVDTAMVGKGGHIICIDDPHKSGEEANSEAARNRVIDWYKSVMYPCRLTGGGVLIVQTRWHEDDLSGYLLKTQPEKWQVVNYPAIAIEDELYRKKGEALFPELYDLDALADIRQTIGEYYWNAQYQQDPLPASGTLLKKEHWRFYSQPFAFYDRMIQVWDFSFKGDDKSDYTVGQVWGKKGANFYLLDQVRGQWEFTQQIEQVQMLSRKYPLAHAKYIEDKANGSAVISMLKNKISGLVAFNPKTDKFNRALVVQPLLQAGNIYLPEERSNPWVTDYIIEHSKFPRAKHDDQVDCTSLAMIQLSGGGLEQLKAFVC